MPTSDGGDAAGTPPALDPSFVQYCAENGIDLAELEAAKRIPRYMYVTAAARRRRGGAHCTAVTAEAGGDEGCDDVLESLRADLPPGMVASYVPWLPRGVAIEVATPTINSTREGDETSNPPPRFSFAKWRPHEEGLVAGMDAASMAAVVALAPQRGDAVLDVCCAPGMKLGMIADAVADEIVVAPPPAPALGQKPAPDGQSACGRLEPDSGGVAVGIDVALHRLHVARSCLRRARRECRQAVLVLADGRAFDPAQVELSHHRRMPAKQWDHRVHRRVNAAAAGGRDKTDAPSQPMVIYEFDGLRQRRAALPQRFDRVLVDAECTHDGSVAHVVHDHTASRRERTAPAQPSAEKGRQTSSQPASPTLTTIEPNDDAALPPPTAESGRRRLHPAGEALRDLQLALLRRGFELVRPGGAVVYSTCSFSHAQNEDLVVAFLDEINAAAGATEGPVAVAEDPVMEAEATLQLTKEEAALFRGRCRFTDLVAAGTGTRYGPSVRFTPMASGTSFQFMAKIRKLDTARDEKIGKS